MAAMAVACATALVSSGCSSSQQARQAAGAEMGQAAARVILPVWPGECRRAVPHASAALGDSPVLVLRRERGQLDIANDQMHRCAAHYDGLKRSIEQGN